MSDPVKNTAAAPSVRHHYLIGIVGFFFLFVQYLLAARLIDGAFINSYPFMSDDSFDWVLEGIALIELLNGTDSTSWPMLRSPGFVLVSALDHLVAANGQILLFAQVLGVALALMSVMWIARTAKLSATSTHAFASVLYFTPMGQYRLYILSDTLASGLMAVTCAGFLAHCNGKGGARSLRYASIAGLAAGLCQTYGLIPLVAMYCCHNCFLFASFRRFDIRMIKHLLIIVACFILISAIWVAWIPHAERPTQFGYLRVSTEMTHFYLNTWLYCFGPLLPFLVWYLVRLFSATRGGLIGDFPQISFAVAVAAFIILTYFYQWPESRFTYIYWPLVVAAMATCFASATNNSNQAAARRRHSQFALGACCLYVIQTVAFPVADPWRPRLETISLSPSSTWLGKLWNATPQDLFSLTSACGSPSRFCKAAIVKPWGSPYRQRILKEVKRKLADR